MAQSVCLDSSFEANEATAEEDIAEARATDPSVADVAVGFMLLDDGQTEEALALAQAGLALRPRCPELLLLLGRAHFLMGDLPNARRVLLHGTMVAPTCAALCVELAQVMLQLGENDRALRTLRRAVRIGCADDDRVGPLYARVLLAMEQQKTRRGSGLVPKLPAPPTEEAPNDEWDALIARAKTNGD